MVAQYVSIDVDIDRQQTESELLLLTYYYYTYLPLRSSYLFYDPVQTPISLDKGHIVSYISAKCETKQMYVFI